jgi:hypothetical protein
MQGAGYSEKSAIAKAAALVLLYACGESMFENSGKRNRLLEDRPVRWK